MPGTALPLRRSPRLTVVSFSDLPGAWASAARPSWYGWPATEPADGKNGGFGGRELLNPRILESGHNMQVVIVASCQGTDSMRGFLYPVPALLLQEKQTTLSGAASASAKKNREDPKTFPKGRHGRSGYEARCTCGCCLLPFVVRGVLIRDIVNRGALLLPPFQFAFPLSNQSYRIGRLYRIISPGIPPTPLADTLV